MADVAENLRAFLMADDAIAAKTAARIGQDSIPQGKPSPYIYFGRTGTESLRCLGETINTPFKHTFAVECWGDDLNDSQALADLVRTRCESAACGGTFGTQTVSNVFCEDQADDYQPTGADPNYGEHVAALSVEVYP